MDNEQKHSMDHRDPSYAYDTPQENEIDLKDLFITLWNNKFFILSIALLTFIIVMTAGLVIRDSEDRVQTVVEFQWDGITDGEYPDGSNFSYSNMFESYVLADSIEASSLDVETNALRDNVEVTPIVPDGISQEIQESLENGEEMDYHAINYKIAIAYDDLDISSQESTTLLNSLMDAFREDFLRTFTQSDITIDYTDADYENYDYEDVHDILLRQADRIESTVENQLPEGGNFTSTELGYGFNEILSRTELIRDIDLCYIDARINNYLLTKDAELRIISYSQLIEENDRRLDTLNTVTEDVQTSISEYTGGEVTIIVPGTDIPEEYVSEPYLSTLYERLTDAQEEIAELESENEYYENRIQRLEGDDPEYALTDEEYDEEIGKVEDSIDSANTRLKTIVDDTETLLEEYNTYKTRNEIRILMAPEDTTEHSIDTLLLGGVSVVLAGMVGLGAVFFKEMFKEN